MTAQDPHAPDWEPATPERAAAHAAAIRARLRTPPPATGNTTRDRAIARARTERSKSNG